MALRKTLTGLVVTLPEGAGIGVVLDATKQGKNLYKASIIADDGSVLIAQFKTNSLNVGEDITYVDHCYYYPDQISEVL